MMDEDSVRQFILSNGGRVANTKLVRHFREELSNPDTKAEAVKKLKHIVRSLTKSDELFVIDDDKGSKTLVLRTKSGGADVSTDSQNSSRPGLQSSMLEALGLLEEKPLGDGDVENLYKAEEAEAKKKADALQLQQEEGASIVRSSSDPALMTQQPYKDSPLSNLEDRLNPMEILNEALQAFEESTVDPEEEKPVNEEPTTDNNKTDAVDSTVEIIEPENELDRSILKIKIEKEETSIRGRSPSATRILSPRNKTHNETEPVEKQSAWTSEELKMMQNQFHAGIEHRQELRQAKKGDRSSAQQHDKDSDAASQSSSTMSEAEKCWLTVAAMCDEKQIRKMLDTRHEQLVNYTADIVSGYTVLHWAAKKGHANIVTLLHNTYQADLNKRTNSGLTPLHLAYQYGHLDVANLLQRMGADRSVRDCYGRKPEHYAHNAHSTQHMTAREIHMLEQQQRRMNGPKKKRLGRDNPLRHSWSSHSVAVPPAPLNMSASSSTSAFNRIGSIKRASSAAWKSILGTKRASWGSAETLSDSTGNEKTTNKYSKHQQVRSPSRPHRLGPERSSLKITHKERLTN